MLRAVSRTLTAGPLLSRDRKSGSRWFQDGALHPSEVPEVLASKMAQGVPSFRHSHPCGVPPALNRAGPGSHQDTAEMTAGDFKARS